MTTHKSVLSALEILDAHFLAFSSISKFAKDTGHPVPCDTRAWSQILVSVLTGLRGLQRKKGADLVDGSDVKGANCWEAINTPRFNGVVPAGRISRTSQKQLSVKALNNTPYIFFVLWDDTPGGVKRCRVWCVRAAKDVVFRHVCGEWYRRRRLGEMSNNFQLHPPRNLDSNEIRNSCGNLIVPLLFCAEQKNDSFKSVHYEPQVLKRGVCKSVD
jgi:hypothetical protein